MKWISFVLQDEDEDKGTIDGASLKAIMSTNWVDPPKRERKRVHNYSEQEYFRQVKGLSSPGGAEISCQIKCILMTYLGILIP